jgi:hypothetical protein
MTLDAIGWDACGEDPDLWVEVPDGVDCGTFCADGVDGIAAAYETDEEGTAWRAILVVVVEAPTERGARDALIAKCSTVADELLGWDHGDDQDDDDGPDDDGPPELPSGPRRVLAARAVEVLPSQAREAAPVKRRK